MHTETQRIMYVVIVAKTSQRKQIWMPTRPGKSALERSSVRYVNTRQVLGLICKNIWRHIVKKTHEPAECAKPPTNISAHFVGTTGRNTDNVYNVFCSQLTRVHERKLTVCRYYFHAVFMLYIFVTVVRLFSQTLNTTCNILKYLVVPYYYYTSNSRLHLNWCTIKGPVARSLTFTWRLN